MGYIRVMHDTFDQLAQCGSGCRWSRKIFYKGLPPRNSHFVKNSVLHLVSRRRQGYPELAITTLSDNGRKGRSFRGGYFEARLRWTKGTIAWPGFWLLSRGNPTAANGPDYLISELDIFEGYGWAPAKFWGTLHRNTSGWYGVLDETRGVVETVGDLTTRFHTYAALWTPTEVAWYLDGRELGRVPVFDSTDQEMFLILDLWIKRNIPVDSGTPAELELQVDHVSVWQKFGDASPRER
jgi:beta-glucanase (GH16 family)